MYKFVSNVKSLEYLRILCLHISWIILHNAMAIINFHNNFWLRLLIDTNVSKWNQEF